MRKQRIKICQNCNSGFSTTGNSVKFCSKKCRNIYHKNKKYEGKTEGVDYVICKWCGSKCERIFGQHVRLSHPDKTENDYKREFPGSPLYCEKDKEQFSKESGKHMKQDRYRQMFSEMIKGERNPNHTSNTTDLQRKERSPYSKEFYISRGYSEEFASEQVSQFAKMDKNHSTTLEYWLDKTDGDIEKAEELLKDRQTTFSLDKCIKRYGEVEGRKRWQMRQKKWKSKVFNKDTHIGRGTSQISEIFFYNLKSNIDNLKKYSILEGKNEKFIHDGTQAYKYDFTIKEIKKIIEFNGDYWHCNPNKYEDDYYHSVKQKLASDLWEYDTYKRELAESHGYSVLVIWESDYKQDPEGEIQKCLNFINDI